MINKKFRVDIVGDLEYKDLIADIYFEDPIVAMLTQEFGFENMEIQYILQKIKPFGILNFQTLKKSSNMPSIVFGNYETTRELIISDRAGSA